MSNEVKPSIRKQNNKARKNGKGTTFFDTRRNRWVSQVVNIYGVREFASFAPNQEDEANEWRLLKIGEKDSYIGSKPDLKNKSVQDFLAKWLEYRSSRNRPNTNRFYSIAIRSRINPLIGSIKAASLTPEHIEKAIDQLIKDGYSAGSIKSVYATLSKAYKDGVRLGWLPYNPMLKVERIQVTGRVSEPIPKADTEKLIKTAQSNLYDLARLIAGVSLGLRPGEVAGLRWSDFDFEKNELHVERQVQYEKGSGLVYRPPKTKRKRPIPLHPDEVNIFKRYRTYHLSREVLGQEGLIKGCPKWEGDVEIVFPNKYGKMQNPKSDIRWFKSLCAKAGIPPYQRYQMRKRAFTDLLKVTNIATVMAYSGHTQASTLLKHYISPEIEDLRKALEGRKAECQYPLQDLDNENGLTT